MRCLLIGPYAENAGASGEDAYVRSLLCSPPAGVEYTHYAELLADKRGARQCWVHALFARLDALGYLKPAPWLETFASDEEFDLVHIHGFDVRLGGRAAARPVVLSTSSYGPENCRSYLGWPAARVARYHRRLRRVFRRLRIYDACNNTMEAAHTVVWSQYARALHLAGGATAERVSVVPPGVAVPQAAARPEGEAGVLFVGQDFSRKGGDILIGAWARMAAPRARLVVIGKEPGNLPAGAQHFEYVSPRELQQHFYPQAHILVLPSRAEGYGLVALEAMAHGLAVIASDTGALPEIVADGETGFLVPVGNAAELARRLRELIYQPNLRRAMGAAARRRVEALFSVEVRNRMLLEIYEKSLGRATAALQEYAAA